MPKNTKVELADGRTVALTPTQASALRAIHEAGTYYSYNGISRATLRVLERHGLVTVKWSVNTWTNYRTKRFHSQCDWSARPATDLTAAGK